MALVLFPLPARDFDPTEAAVSWRVLTGLGHRAVFATPEGRPGRADDLMLTGRGLDLWGSVPLLREVPLVGLALRANGDGRRAYAALERDPAFSSPLRWSDLRAADFDGVLLAGGHRSRGMRAYLESAALQELVASFFGAGKPVGAVCHGVH